MDGLTSAIVNDMDVCLICKRPRQQVHHVFGKYNRAKSDFYHYLVPLCEEHHTGTHGVHRNRQMDVHLKQMAQRHFEKNHGSREDFINQFGKSWI